MTRRILVTGANGKSGRLVVQAVGDQGLKDPNIECIKAPRTPGPADRRLDFTDPATFPEALDGRPRRSATTSPPAQAAAQPRWRPILIDATTSGPQPNPGDASPGFASSFPKESHVDLDAM